METQDGQTQKNKMKLHEFIPLNSIFINVDVDSKKNAFKVIANFFEKKKSQFDGSDYRET